MKKQITLLAILLVAYTSMAQTGFNYKALITNNGNVLSNHNVSIKFTILQGSTSVYQETQTTTTDTNGIVAVNIGEGTAVSGNFTTIDWATDTSLKVEMDTGNSYYNFGTSELKSVPYAKYAEAGGSVQKIDDLSDARHISNSLFLGYQSGINDDGTTNENVGVGQYSLKNNTSGAGNVAVGKASLLHNISGTSNVAVGKEALLQNTTGQDNIGVGLRALRATTTGHHNVAIGTGAGFENHVGSFNIFIGTSAGFHETGNNRLYIENSDVSTPLIGGDFASNYVNINGKMLVGSNNSPTGRLQTIPVGNMSSNSNLNVSNAGLLVGTNTNGLAFDNNQIEKVGQGELFLNFASNNNIILAKGGGKVGIGTTNPTQLLHIKGNNASLKLETGSKYALLRRFTNRLLIETNDMIQFGTGGGLDFDMTLEHSGDLKLNHKLITPSTGTADMKASMFASVNADGTSFGSHNYQIIKNSLYAGIYKFNLTDQNFNTNDYVILVSIDDTGFGFARTVWVDNSHIEVQTFNTSGGRADRKFKIIAYKK